MGHSPQLSPPLPDYEAEDVLVVREPERLRALGDDLRSTIVSLLRDRAYSTTELAEKLGLPKGTVGHHLKVLENAGLIRVVRTRKVRAVTEKFYGRVARLFLFESTDADGEDIRNLVAAALRRVAEEMVPQAIGDDDLTTFGVVRARLTDADAKRLSRRLKKVIDDFRAAESADGKEYGSPPLSTGDPSMRRPHIPRGGLWENLDFVKLWTGQTISEFGSAVSGLAIPWLAAKELNASPFEFSLLGVLGFLPFIVFALPAGVWVDRLRRRPILIVGDASRAVLLAWIPLAWLLGILTIWQLFAITFVVGIFTVFFDVAYQSYLPSLVERDQLTDGNSKLQTTASAAQIAGPGLAGVLIGALTAPYAILVDAASFVVSTLFMIPIRRVETLPERKENAPKPKMLPELKEGLLYVVQHRYLKWIAACTGSANFFGAIAFSIGVLYMARDLHMSSLAAGVVMAGFGVGSIVGAVLTPRFQKAVGVGRAIWIPAMMFSLAGFAFPLAPAGFPVPVLLVGTLAFGIGGMAYNITQVSLRQAITPERMQGRMNASMRWIVWGTMPIGSLVGGAIATTYSIKTALWVGAIGSAFTFLPVLLSSVAKIRVMPTQIEEITPAEANLGGGLLEPAALPGTE